MDDSEAAIADLAREVRRFLEANRAARWISFPFAASFPSNACEGTSCLLAHVLEAALGLPDVQVIEGYDPAKATFHYWVETGGRIYDLTADQFEGREVVLGGSASALTATFTETQPVARRYSNREQADEVLRSLSPKTSSS